MPSRVFDQFDLINVVNGPVNLTTPATGMPDFSVIYISPSNFSAQIVGNAGPGVFVQLKTGVGNYLVSGDVDFTNFPAVPPTATITRIIRTVKFVQHATADSNGTFGNLNLPAGMDPGAQTGLPHVDSGAGALSFVLGSVGEITETTDFDTAYFLANFSTPTITYAQLVANFDDFDLFIGVGGEWVASNFNGSISLLYNLQFTGWTLEVFYGDAPFMFDITLDTPGPSKVADVVRISSRDPILRDVTDIIVTPAGEDPIHLDPVLYTIIWTPELLTFWLPFELGDFEGNVTITLVIDSTEFSGSVLLGTLVIFFEDGSGIYTITPGTRLDTLYSADRDGTTFEAAIPNPSAKTAYLGGGD